MAKLSIDELECLVMEGGGARGTAYYGATKALQAIMAKRSEKPDSKFVFHKASEGKKAQASNSILDYIDRKSGELKIQGVGGASAGAITTCALAFGLNADKIREILEEYQFPKFLTEKSIGKYRMVDENSELFIGEDDGGELGGKREKYVYARKVHDNAAKRVKRNLLVTLAVKVIGDGIITNLDQLLNNRFSREVLDGPSWIWRTVRGWFRRVSDVVSRFGLGIVSWKLVSLFIFQKLKAKLPIKVDADIVGNILCDNGAFAGFAVREFFYDMAVFALMNDTHFRRCMVKNLSDEQKRVLQLPFDVDESCFDFGTFKFGTREVEGETWKQIKPVLEFLKTMTFGEFYRITGLDYKICASNFTTGQPNYFCYQETPDFPMLEAAAGSMSIPPAIKPLYNAADVFYGGDSKDEWVKRIRYINVPYTVDASKQVFSLRPFVDKNGRFNQRDYYFFELIVKKLLREEMIREKDEKKQIFLSSNNKIDTSAFLGKLNQMLGVDPETPFATREELKSKTYKVEMYNKIYVVYYELLLFFYNAHFKGMFLDGGYRNNIPYNAFRQKEGATEIVVQEGKEVVNDISGQLKGVLAIKLDGQFPADLLDDLYEQIPVYRKHGKEIRNYAAVRGAKRMFQEEPGFDAVYDQPLSFDMNLLVQRTKIVFIDYMEKNKALNISAQELEKLLKGDEGILKLMIEVVDYYDKNNLRRPWTIRHSILEISTDGYGYGYEMGQIQRPSDHNHIIPLYDYGVGLYDFDLNKVRSMEVLSHHMAEADVNAYFSK